MIEPEIFLGPPGSGKTTTLLDVVDAELAAGTEPERIGFFSFTQKAAREAAERACARFSLERSRFQYFRTLHSMCFRSLGLTGGDVLAGARFQEFADWCGIRVTGRAWSDDGLLEGFEVGDRMLFMENLARIQEVPLRALYDEGDDGLEWREVDRVSRALAEFKASRGLLDYTDMLSEFVRKRPRVSIDVLIVDECQDLSKLQWRVVETMARGARRVVTAGDDDQAIYRWAGAAVDYFIGMRGRSSVLGQSWRCPPAVQLLSNEIISGVRHRRPKQWRARDGEEGRFARSREFGDVDVDDAWAEDDRDHQRPPVLVLARNVYLLRRDVEPLLRAQGIVYESSTGKSSLDLTALEAAESWTRLGKGEEISVAAARKMYEFLPANTGVRRGHKKLPKFDETDTVGGAELAQFGGLLTSLRTPWHEALTRVSPEDVAYMRAARRRGERLRSRPRVRISTIHSAKGGEADHVVLLTEMAARTYREMERNPDDERRVFYVGVTRARRKLTAVDAREGRYCPWI